MNFSPEKALTHRLIMFAGDEEALRRRAVESLLEAAGIQKDDFDLEVFSGDSSGPADWCAAVGIAPFLSARRTAIVRNLLRFDLDRAKGKVFTVLPETSLLILVCDDEPGSDDRQRSLKSARAKWAKAVKDAGGAEYAFDPDPKEALAGIRREVARLGKKITESAAVTLVEMTGASLSRAIDEIGKLDVFVGDQEQIREADVRAIVVPSREWNVYKMVDSVFSGQVTEALRQLRVLVGSQTKAEDAAFSRILPGVSRQLRLLWQARMCVEAGCGPSELNSCAFRMFPTKNAISAEQPYRLGSLMSSARRLSLPQISHCFSIVANTDARLKGSLASFSSIDTLERMLLDMASVVAPPRR